MSKEEAQQKESDPLNEHLVGSATPKGQEPQQNPIDSEGESRNAHKEPTPAGAIYSVVAFIRSVVAFIRNPQNAAPIQAVCTVLIFVTGVFYTIFAGLQWKTMGQQIELMKAVERPYVGVLEIRTNQDEASRDEIILAILKNFGKNPAFNFTARWKILVNGVDQAPPGGPRPFTFFPGANQALQLKVTKQRWDAYLSSTDVLRLRVNAYYEWPGGTYTECEEREYDRQLGQFRIIGSCTPGPD